MDCSAFATSSLLVDESQAEVGKAKPWAIRSAWERGTGERPSETFGRISGRSGRARDTLDRDNLHKVHCTQVMHMSRINIPIGLI